MDPNLTLNEWKVYLNFRISPIHYFFDTFDIKTSALKQLNSRPIASSSSSSTSKSIQLSDIFDAAEKMIPIIVEDNEPFDIGDTMVMCKIIQLLSEAFASRLGYVSKESELIPALLNLKDYMLSDPRESHEGILGLKAREENTELFSFPFISPFSVTPSLKFGSQFQLTQMIIHSISQFEQ